MLRSSSGENNGQYAAGPPPILSSRSMSNGTSSLPEPYPPPQDTLSSNPYAGSMTGSGGAAPPLLHHSPPSYPPPPAVSAHESTELQLHHLQGSQPSLSRASLPYAALTPEREDALRAKGRQLLEEHRRESAAGGGAAAYTPAEKAALQQRGMELLRAAREETAANGGQHIPAPMLSAAARVAAATTPLVRRREESAQGGDNSGSSNETHAHHAGAHLPQKLAPVASSPVHSPQQQQQQQAMKHVDGNISSAAGAQAHIQELTAEVQRLQGIITAQQAELANARATSASPSSAELFTKTQMDNARQDLIQQFNEHMAQCEKANQDYWASVSAEHQQEVASVRHECDNLQRQLESVQTAQRKASESDADTTAALHQTVEELKRDLDVAQRECTAARLAQEAAEQETSLLAEALRDQREEVAQLEAALTAAAAEANTARVEAERVAQAARAKSAELSVVRANCDAMERTLHEHQSAYAELQALYAELQAANAQLMAAQATAAAAPSSHDAANPFADADAEDPFGDSSHAAPASVAAAAADDSELRAARERIAMLEGTAHELDAARQHIGDLEDALTEAAGDVEKLQEDLQDKEHLIQALRAGEAALSSLPVDAMCSGSGWGAMLPSDSVDGGAEAITELSAEAAPALRMRVHELSRQLEEERRAHHRVVEELRVQKPLSPSSQMVPGMEELGRRYADVQHRLSLAEDARATLEEEVRRLRDGDRRGAGAVQGSSTAAADVSTSANPFNETDESGEEGEIDGAVVTVRAGRNAQNVTHHSLPRHRQLSGDEEGRNTPETQASFHMGRDEDAVRSSSPLADDTVFEEGEDVVCQDDDFHGEPFSPSREEEQSETLTTSAAARGEEATQRAPRESGELMDDEETTTEDADVSVSTRVAAARGRLPPARANKVEDSGVAMQELGRQYAEAQYRLLRSEEARQSLESEVAELRHQLEQRHTQPSVEETRENYPDNEFDDVDDEEDETRTVTTSFASSVPTAARGRLTNPFGTSEGDADGATDTLKNSRGPSDPAARSRREEDETALGLVATATFSERGDEGDDGDEARGADHVAIESDANEVNAALHRRIEELEDELQTLCANHEEELQALANAAADRIAALEQEYVATAPPRVVEETEEEAVQQQQRDEDGEGDVFGTVNIAPVVHDDAAPLAAVAAARVEWERDLEEERVEHARRLHACERDAAALKADLMARADEIEVCRKSLGACEEEAEGLRAELASAHASQSDLQAELHHTQEQWTSLSKTLEEMQAAHEAELAAVTAECNREIEEHDELLRQRLEEQEESYEAAIQQLDQQHQDQLRLLADSAEAAASSSEDDVSDNGKGASQKSTEGSEQRHPETKSATAGQAVEVAYWREQHSILQGRFNQLQRDYDDFAQDTAAMQRRLREQEAVQQEQEHNRTTRDAAAQQLTSLHQRLDEMTHLVEGAQADAQARSHELREANARHTHVETTLRDELASARAQAQSSRDEVARLNDLNEELSELLQQGATGVEAALRDRDAQLTALETQVRDLKLQVAAAGDRLAERQALLQEQRDATDALQQRVEELQSANRALEVQLGEARRAAEEQARRAAHEIDRAVRDAEQARLAAQHAVADGHLAHQGDIAALQAQLDDLRNELEVAQTVAATVPLEAQKHQRDLETVRERLTEALRVQQELQQQLRNSRGEVERQRRLLRGVNADGSEVNASAITGEEDGAPTGASDARVNALLRSVEELEEKLQEASTERDDYQQERDRVTMQLKSAARVADVKEQAMRRQEAELRGMRAQLATLRDDLAQRVQSNHALQLEMDHLQERVEDLVGANADLQEQQATIAERRTAQDHAEALLFAKAMTIPRALEDHVSVLCSSYHALLQVSSKDREYVYGRCDMIEKAAGEAMAEAEAQNQAYEAALADAQEEQQQLKAIIEDMEEAMHRAEETKVAAVTEAKAAKEELEAVQRQAREDVFSAQRDLQVAELQHADTLHSLSLLQDEVTNTASLIKNQKATYERREAELAEEVRQLQAELETRKVSARLLQQSTDENRNGLQDVADQAEQRRDEAVREAQALRAQLERALPRLAQLEDDQAQRTADLMDTAQQLSALHKKTSSTEEVSRKHIEELNQTLQELLRAHAVLQRTHTTTEATADRLRAQLDMVSQELERATAKSHQQEEEVTLLRGRLQEVETRTNRVITDDQARLRDADRRLQGLEQRNTALQQECKSLQESQQSLRMEFESTADALQRRTETSAALEQQQAHQIRLLRERADTLEAERQELLTSEQAITKERDVGLREVLMLQHKIEHLQHHLSDANVHNETLNREMVELKTEHTAEVDRLREAITDAQKELAKCRQLLAEAETHQVEQDSAHYSLTSEMNMLREELKSARAQAERSQQQYQKEKTEREEMATLLQSQMAQLYEELRGKQEQLRALENTAAGQLDTINALRQDVAEAEERLKHTRKELLDSQEAATAAKEHHRRDRYELQSKLNIAEDAVAEMTRQQEQYRQRMTTKVELYEVAEQALRGEVTDLRADVARLEETLTATTHGKEAAEDVKSRQAHSIKAVESEVQTLRAQTARDMSELTALKVQLQQRTAEAERVRREAAALLAAEKLRWETEHAAACDALEEALRKEQQATKDAREARERALASLDRKQKDVAAMEEECRAMRAQLRQLQRRVDAAEYQLTALEGMAKDSAEDLGVSLGELLGGALVEEGGLLAQESTLSSSAGAGDATTANATSATAAAGASVQAVLDELLRRLNLYTFAANTLDTEDAQLAALTQALEQQQDAVDVLMEAAANASARSEGAATTHYASGVTPVRGGSGGALGLNSTPAARGGAPFSGSGGAAPSPGAFNAGFPRALTPAQQVFVQQISQASSTYVHRAEDHVRTAQQMLRAVAMAVGAHEVVVASGAHAGGGASALHTRPTTVALSSRHKLQVAATIAELHRRTAALTRAVERVVEGIVGSPTTATAGALGDRASSTSSPTTAASLHASLQELRRLFAEAERFALLPFNELLCLGESGGSAAPVSAAGGAANVGESSYGGRGRHGDGLRTPTRTPQPSSSAAAAAPRSSATDSNAQRGPATRGAQLQPPPSLSLTTHPSSHRHSGGGAEQPRTRADESALVSSLSPIPPDEEANWF